VTEDGLVLVLDTPSRGGAFAYHKQPRDRGARPTSVTRQEAGQSRLAIEGHEHTAHVGDYRLDFDDEESASLGVPCENVDRPSLASDGKGHLDRDQPACPIKATDRRIDESRVIGVQQPIEPFALPWQPDLKSCTQRRGQALQDANADPIELPQLGAGYLALRHCCPIGDVLLAQAAAATKGLEASAEADRIHRAKRMTARVQH